MAHIPRRRFLNQAGTAGLAVAANGWLSRAFRAQTGSAITRVVVPAHVVTYDLSTVEDGFEYRLTLRLQPGVPHGKLEGTVEIFTDHPGESRLVVPLFAIVRDGHKRG